MLSTMILALTLAWYDPIDDETMCVYVEGPRVVLITFDGDVDCPKEWKG